MFVVTHVVPVHSNVDILYLLRGTWDDGAFDIGP